MKEKIQCERVPVLLIIEPSARTASAPITHAVRDNCLATVAIEASVHKVTLEIAPFRVFKGVFRVMDSIYRTTIEC